MEFQTNSDIARMEYRSKKGSWKQLTLERAAKLPLKRTLQAIDEFAVPNKHYGWERHTAPKDCIAAISLSGYNPDQFLRFIICVGEAGLYLGHDWEQKKVYLGFENKESRVEDMGYLEIQVKLAGLSWKD